MSAYDDDHRATDVQNAREYDAVQGPGWLAITAGVAFILFIFYAALSGAPDRPEPTDIPRTTTTTPSAPTTQPQ